MDTLTAPEVVVSTELMRTLERRDQAAQELRTAIALAESAAAEAVETFLKALLVSRGEKGRADRGTAYPRGSAHKCS
jgi:hypothetical protein